MRPAFAVIDIPYNPENLDKKVQALIDPLIHLLPKDDYSGETEPQIQDRLLKQISAGIENQDFMLWAYDNSLWLQIDDQEKREYVHFDLLTRYLKTLDDKVKQEELLADYINEMKVQDLGVWEMNGRELLNNLLAK